MLKVGARADGSGYKCNRNPGECIHNTVLCRICGAKHSPSTRQLLINAPSYPTQCLSLSFPNNNGPFDLCSTPHIQLQFHFHFRPRCLQKAYRARPHFPSTIRQASNLWFFRCSPHRPSRAYPRVRSIPECQWQARKVARSDRECSLCVLRHAWRGCRPCLYQDTSLLTNFLLISPFHRRSHPQGPSLQVLELFSWSLSLLIPLTWLCSDLQILQAAKQVRDCQATLIGLFTRIDYFFKRLEIHARVPPTAAMMSIMVDIMVEVISLLGIVTQEIKRCRISGLTACIVMTLY